MTILSLEEWRPVKGYEGLYFVSNTGRIRSNYKGGRTLKIQTQHTGYKTVELFNNRIGKTLCVHRIVAEAFIPNPDNKPQVNHKDETRFNNHVSNLEWVTAKENQNYGTCKKRRAAKINYATQMRKDIARKNSQKSRKPVVQYDKDGNVVRSFVSGSEASRATNVQPTKISACALGKRKSAGGYIWKFVKEE